MWLTTVKIDELDRLRVPTEGERELGRALTLLENDRTGSVTVAALRSVGSGHPPRPCTTSSSQASRSTESPQPAPADARHPATACATRSTANSIRTPTAPELVPTTTDDRRTRAPPIVVRRTAPHLRQSR